MGGDSPRLASLRRACGPDVAFVVLDYPNWRQTLPGIGDIETIVAGFMATIQRRTPVGPVMVAGYSMGASIAYALAFRLEAAGRDVAFVGMIDGEARPYTKGMNRQRGVSVARRLYWSIVKGAKAAKQGLVIEKVIIKGTAALMQPRHRAKLNLLTRSPSITHPRFLVDPARRYLTEASHIRLVEPWAAAMAPEHPLAAPVTLFRSSEHPETAPEDLGWRPLCANLDIVSVAGSHEGMLARVHTALVERLDRAAQR